MSQSEARCLQLELGCVIPTTCCCQFVPGLTIWTFAYKMKQWNTPAYLVTVSVWKFQLFMSFALWVLDHLRTRHESKRVQCTCLIPVPGECGLDTRENGLHSLTCLNWTSDPTSARAARFYRNKDRLLKHGKVWSVESPWGLWAGWIQKRASES